MNHLLREILRDPAFPEGEAWVRRHFSPNEVIVREGETDRKMYLIERGTLRVSARVELDDKRTIQPGLHDLGAGDLFGELPLFEARPRSATVMAIEEGELLEIDCPQLSAYMDQRPAIGYQVLKAMFRILIGRFDEANQRVEHLMAWGLKVHGIDKVL